MIRRLDSVIAANPLLGQLVRFAIAGGLSTGIYSAVYLPLTATVFPAERAVWAVPFAFAVAVTAGYFLHSRWSFRGHGREETAAQRAKFVGVQALGLVLNALLTWLVTAPLGLPSWAALVPVVTITPLVTFFINRHWVFG